MMKNLRLFPTILIMFFSLLALLFLKGLQGHSYLPVCLKFLKFIRVLISDALSCGQVILYDSSREERKAKESPRSIGQSLPSGVEVLGPVVPPPLVLPSEQYPSVLITEAKSSNAVTIR